jgi:hypothetical protein
VKSDDDRVFIVEEAVGMSCEAAIGEDDEEDEDGTR